jgi:Putative transposase
MTLAATEFLRRFFLHVLPKGFVRIRHFGFLANRFRASHTTARLRRRSTPEEVHPQQVPSESSSPWHCPRCGSTMVVIQRFSAAELALCTTSIPPNPSSHHGAWLCESTPMHSCIQPMPIASFTTFPQPVFPVPTAGHTISTWFSTTSS